MNTEVSFGTFNYIVMIGYLLSMVMVGVWFAKRQKSTADYFKAGGRIPGWAAGVSVFATTLSSITFMSIPAKAYTENWIWILGQYVVLLIMPLVYFFYVPQLRKLQITSVYEYLESRFDVRSRIFASICFILFQIGRIAIVTFLTVQAVISFIDIDPLVVVFFVGVLCIFYTYMGGIEGVVWTDVIQGILLICGAILIFAFICFKVNGGLGEIVMQTQLADKFFPASELRWSWTETTIPIVIIGFFFANLQSFTASQDVVQRYVVTENMEQTKKTLWMNARLVATVPILFFAIGSGLYVFYHQHPDLLPENFNISRIVPYFIVTQLPVGVAGLIIAAIFAAAQSTISSSLNSVASSINSDLYRRFKKTAVTDGELMRVARLSIVVCGVFSMAATVYFVKTNASQLWDAFNALLGLLGGPVTGLFMLGVFSKKATGTSAFIGLVVSVIALLLAKYLLMLNFFFYAIIGTMTVVVIGIVLAPFFSNTKPVSREIK